jgi:hypothetical protein
MALLAIVVSGIRAVSTGMLDNEGDAHYDGGAM